jgi:hypothetical protein
MTVPLLEHKQYEVQSVFTAENMLREARRQKSLPEGVVPAICILDPDGDLAHYLTIWSSRSAPDLGLLSHQTLCL